MDCSHTEASSQTDGIVARAPRHENEATPRLPSHSRRSVRHPEIPWQIVLNDSVNLMILTARHFYMINPHLVQTFFSVNWSAKKTRAKKFFQSLFYGRNELAVHQQTRQHFARAVARVAGRAREVSNYRFQGELFEETRTGAMPSVSAVIAIFSRCRITDWCETWRVRPI